MLTPAASLTLGDLRYDTHAVALRLSRRKLPATDRLDVLLPAGVRFEAVPGDPVLLDLDGGEGAELVFTGVLHAVQRRLDGISITARGPAHALAQTRPVLALEAISTGDAIRALCDAAGVATGTIEDGPRLALYALDGRATALSEIARLGALSGLGAAFDGEGALHVTPFGGPEAEIAIKHGREIIEAEIIQALDDAPAPFVAGEGADEAGKPRARLLAQAFNPGAAPENARRFAHPELRSTDDTRAAAAAITHARSRAAQRVRLVTFLLPLAAPGMRIETQDMPDSLPLAEMRVEQVTHLLLADGAATTTLTGTAVTGASPGLAELLGALL
jgi:hypothetical protein